MGCGQAILLEWVRWTCFSCRLPSKFQLEMKFDRVSSGLLTLPDVGADLCLVLFYKKTYSRISNWSITQTLLYQNSRHPVQNHNPPLHSFITPLHFPLPSHTFSISLPYTFCCLSWHYVLASYIDWYRFEGLLKSLFSCKLIPIPIMWRMICKCWSHP